MLRLPGAVLAQMRAAAESLMTDTCTLEARSASAGEYGEPTEEFVVVDASVPCRVITMDNRFFAQQQNPETAGREHIMDAYRLIVPAGTALDVDYRVTLSNGDVYHVVDLITERTDETDSQAIIVRVR